MCFKSTKDKRQASQRQLHQVVHVHYDDTYFLGVVTNESDIEAWKVKLKVNRRLLTFTIDTSTDFSIMDELTYHSLRPKPRLCTHEFCNQLAEKSGWRIVVFGKHIKHKLLNYYQTQRQTVFTNTACYIWMRDRQPVMT